MILSRHRRRRRCRMRLLHSVFSHFWTLLLLVFVSISLNPLLYVHCVTRHYDDSNYYYSEPIGRVPVAIPTNPTSKPVAPTSVPLTINYETRHNARSISYIVFVSVVVIGLFGCFIVPRKRCRHSRATRKRKLHETRDDSQSGSIRSNQGTEIVDSISRNPTLSFNKSFDGIIFEEEFRSDVDLEDGYNEHYRNANQDTVTIPEELSENSLNNKFLISNTSTIFFDDIWDESSDDDGDGNENDKNEDLPVSVDVDRISCVVEFPKYEGQSEPLDVDSVCFVAEPHKLDVKFEKLHVDADCSVEATQNYEDESGPMKADNVCCVQDAQKDEDQSEQIDVDKVNGLEGTAMCGAQIVQLHVEKDSSAETTQNYESQSGPMKADNAFCVQDTQNYKDQSGPLDVDKDYGLEETQKCEFQLEQLLVDVEKCCLMKVSQKYADQSGQMDVDNLSSVKDPQKWEDKSGSIDVDKVYSIEETQNYEDRSDSIYIKIGFCVDENEKDDEDGSGPVDVDTGCYLVQSVGLSDARTSRRRKKRPRVSTKYSNKSAKKIRDAYLKEKTCIVELQPIFESSSRSERSGCCDNDDDEDTVMSSESYHIHPNPCMASDCDDTQYPAYIGSTTHLILV